MFGILMPMGETPGGHDGRSELQHQLAVEWLDMQDPELAALHGPLLLDIVDARIAAHDHDDSIEVLKFSWLLRRRHGDVVRLDDRMAYAEKLRAQSVYRGLEPRNGPTGEDAFDRLFNLQDKLVGNAADSEYFSRLLGVLESTERAALAIRSRTRPGPLAA